MSSRVVLAFTLVCYTLPGALGASASAEGTASIGAEPPALDGWLMIDAVAGGGRSILRTDPVEHAIVTGVWSAPSAGVVVTRGDGESRTWREATPDADGWIRDDGLRGGYVFAMARADADQVAILDAAGHSMVYVNGQPRMGDPYEYGYLQLPVELKAGTNTFLFRIDRGGLRARLVRPKSGVYLNPADPTLPDQVVGESQRLVGAVVVVNATREPITPGQLRIRTHFAGGADEIDVPSILPLTRRKVPIAIAGRPDAPAGKAPLKLELLARGGEEALDSAELAMRVAEPHDWRRVTFTSAIDGSVQYYAMWPPAPGSDPNALPGLIFTLHGASVEATNQVQAYQPKSWAYIVAPTNRRPYGFDWEDWGRLDALEVWDQFLAKHQTDASRRWLTGHSMGGHGTWQLGGHFPDRFAAIAPCAGWVSFFSYAAAKEYHPIQGDSKLASLLRRATNASDTLGLSGNWRHYGVYVLHGDADDNVPVTEARTMRARLGAFHPDFGYYEKPGGGHWWDNSAVDWPPLIEFLRGRTRRPPREVREIDFTTMDPGISMSSHWLAIVEQERVLAPSRVQIRFDAERRRFEAITENVAAVAILAVPPGVISAIPALAIAPDEEVTADIDGQSVHVPPGARTASGAILLRRRAEQWRACPGGQHDACDVQMRAHSFKAAFAKHMRFVYGTAGTAEENAWSLAKARYDAEQWYYRGNGSVDIIADREFDITRLDLRSHIVYGNATTNLAVKPLLHDSHASADAGVVSLGSRRLAGDSFAALILHDRGGSPPTLVGVIAPTGPAGMRLCDRLPYFVSGVAYPDVTVLTPDVLVHGLPGVVAAGFLGGDGTVEGGEFEFAE